MQATDLDLASRPGAACDGTPCGELAARALCTRVSALRAALEGLEGSLPQQDRSLAIVLGARRELEILARDVRAVVEWAAAPTPHALSCSFEEIGLGAVDALTRQDRGRTLVAVEHPRARLLADGTLLSRALARLVEHGFGQGAEHAALQIVASAGTFTAAVSFDGKAAPSATVSSSLAGELARRDLARLGAHVSCDESTRRFVVELETTEDAR